MTEHPEHAEPSENDPPADTATQPEDHDPLSHIGDATDAPEDTGRSQGVAP